MRNKADIKTGQLFQIETFEDGRYLSYEERKLSEAVYLLGRIAADIETIKERTVTSDRN